MQMAERKEIRGWKAIAEYLDSSVRAAQNWETSERLPIRRRSKGSLDRVFAFSDELDKWRDERENGFPGDDDHGKQHVSSQSQLAVMAEPMAAKKSRLTMWLAISPVVLLTLGAILYSKGFVSNRPPPPHPPPSSFPRRLLSQVTAEGTGPVRIRLPYRPAKVALRSDKKLAYVAAADEPILMMVFVDTGDVREIPLPFLSRALRLAPDEKRLYVSGQADGLVAIDLDSGKHLWSQPLGGSAYDIVITPDERWAFLAMNTLGVFRLDLRTKSVQRFKPFECPYDLDLDRSGSTLLVSYQCGGPGGKNGHDAVELYDVENGQVQRSLDHRVPLVGGAHRFSPQSDLILLDGADACVTATYDRAGCPPKAGPVYHLWRLSDGRILQTGTVPVRHGGKPTWLRDGDRILLSAKYVMDSLRFVGLEQAPDPQIHFFDAQLAPDNELLVGTDQIYDNRDLVVIRPEPPGCVPELAGLHEKLAFDGTTNASITNTFISGEPASFKAGVRGQALVTGLPDLAAISSVEPPFPKFDATLSFFYKASVRSLPAKLLERMEQKTDSGWRLSISGEGGLVLLLSGPKGQFQIRSGARYIKPDRWNHVAITRSKGDVCLYVNGSEIACDAVPKSFESPSVYVRTPLKISGSGFAQGLIDEFTTWNRALSRQQLRAFFERQTSPPCRPSF